MKKLFLLLLLTSLMSCNEKPDKSIEVPEVLIIKDYIDSNWGLNKSEINILRYSESDINTVHDSVMNYYFQCGFGNNLQENKLSVDSIIDKISSRIDVYKTEADSLNNIIMVEKKNRDKYYKTNNRKKYRADYQNWVAFKRMHPKIETRINELNDSIISLNGFIKKIINLKDLPQDSVLSKYSTVKVKARVDGKVQKSLLKYLLIASSNGFDVKQLDSEVFLRK